MPLKDVHDVVPGDIVVVPEGFPLMRHAKLTPPEHDQHLRVVAVEHDPHGDAGSFTVRLVFGEGLWAEYASRDRVSMINET